MGKEENPFFQWQADEGQCYPVPYRTCTCRDAKAVQPKRLKKFQLSETNQNRDQDDQKGDFQNF